MTIVNAQMIGDKAVLPRAQLDQLIALARKCEEVEMRTSEDDLPTIGLMRLADQGGAFDWLAADEDLYTVDDLKVRYQ